MNLYFRFLLLGLASMRLGQLVSIDDGIGLFILKFRMLLGRVAGAHPKSMFWKTVADQVYCQYCTGFVFAVLLTPLVLFPGKVGDGLLLLMGGAGLHTFITTIGGRRGKDTDDL